MGEYADMANERCMSDIVHYDTFRDASPDDRYRSCPHYRNLVHTLAKFAKTHNTNIVDLREACLLALMLNERKKDLSAE